MTADLDIGFPEKPVDLEGFLQREGYLQIKERPASRTLKMFEHEMGWPMVFYNLKPTKVSGDEQPNWRKAGFKVVSELNINYHPSDSSATDEALRLAEAVANAFNGVMYDPNLDAYIPY